MAHYVGKTLHIRPNEILDTWSTPELIVAFGHYANEIQHLEFDRWSKSGAKNMLNSEPPKEYVVQFIDTRNYG